MDDPRAPADPIDPDPWDVPRPEPPPAEWQSAEFLREADAVFSRYPRRINALLPILQLAATHHPLTPATLPHIARLCWATTDQAQQVAQAYGLVHLEEGTPTVTFCVNVHCLRNGAGALRDSCAAVLRGQPVRLREYVCFGYCDEGPCVEVNDQLIVEATAGKIIAALAGDSSDSPIDQ